jgi:hypothetical protein
MRIHAEAFTHADLGKVWRGYRRYVPVAGGVRFLTAYAYRSRCGTAGRLADRLFRPVFGWATAWSFDRLRLWLERSISPAASRWCGLTETAGTRRRFRKVAPEMQRRSGMSPVADTACVGTGVTDRIWRGGRRHLRPARH